VRNLVISHDINEERVMKIIFLGTGTSQGIPVIACNCGACRSSSKKDKRLRSSIYIEKNSMHLVIDSGPDFRQQMLRENVNKLDAILLTHEHKDHVGGLDDVRGFNFKQNKPMDVYARKNVLEQIKKEFSYAFAKDRYPGVPEVNLHEVVNKPFEISNISITPINVLHYKLKVYGYRISDFTYITDASFIPDEEIDKIRGSKVLILNALRKKMHYSHFNLEQALEIIDRIKPKNAFLTHISHLMGIHDEIEKELPENIKLAYDGLSIEL
jgi:phosphoribosyl 1,2-cyclic phosphate phosphodiesterase